MNKAIADAIAIKNSPKPQEKFPLVQRQWETVSQFRSQISHKATLALREQKINSKVSERVTRCTDH